LIRVYSRQLEWGLITIPAPVSSPVILVAGYMVLSLPYMYRAVDVGMRTIDVRTLTEAAQSLGASWITIIFRIVLPNLTTALLSGSFLTFAIVLGELTLAQFLAWPAFGPYLQRQVANRAYEPAALSLISFALTWAVIGLIQFIGRKSAGQAQLGGTH
jgi:putative spermidine/putrescine transport system permease protein